MAKVENLKPWKPGQSGNPAGRPKRKTLSEYATEQLDRIVDPETGKTRGEEIVEGWLNNAVVTPALLIELLNRTEGKVKDNLNLGFSGDSLAALLIALKKPSGNSN